MNGILSFNNRNFSIWIGAISLLLFLFFGYVDPFAIVIAYFLESVLIGLLNIVKMLLTSREKNKNIEGGLVFKCIFFLVHYGFFIFVQSIFVFAMFSTTDKNIKEPFRVIENFSYAFTIDGFGISIIIMATVLLLETYINYIHPKAYKNVSADDLFFKPYLRVIIQQFTVLLALFLVMVTGLEVIVATILILLRLLVDLTGIYISSNDKNLERVARFVKKDHTRSDIKAMEELKKYL